jgi:hypothetical protein
MSQSSFKQSGMDDALRYAPEHAEFLNELLSKTFRFNYRRDPSYINKNAEELMEVNQAVSDLWIKVLNYEEFRGQDIRLPQLILYDRCLKYLDMKSMCAKLNVTEFFVHLNPEKIDLQRINYHSLDGRLTEFSRFVTTAFPILWNLNLMESRGYAVFVQLFVRYLKQERSQSYNDLIKLATGGSNGTEIFVLSSLIMSLNRELEKDYANLRNEIYRVSHIISKNVNLKLDTTKYSLYFLGASVAVAICTLIAAFVHRSG